MWGPCTLQPQGPKRWLRNIQSHHPSIREACAQLDICFAHTPLVIFLCFVPVIFLFSMGEKLCSFKRNFPPSFSSFPPSILSLACLRQLHHRAAREKKKLQVGRWVETFLKQKQKKIQLKLPLSCTPVQRERYFASPPPPNNSACLHSSVYFNCTISCHFPMGVMQAFLQDPSKAFSRREPQETERKQNPFALSQLFSLCGPTR